MMEISIKTDKKDYFKCSMYLMKKYFGVREAVLLAILFVAGILLYIFTNNVLILALFGLTGALLLFTFVLFLWTAISGYKVDILRKDVALIKLNFSEKTLDATSYTRTGEALFTETHHYEKLENIVIKKQKIYVYAGVAVFYYINRDELKLQEFDQLIALLKEHVPPQKFAFRKRVRTYPKRQKITLDKTTKK